MPIGWRPRTTRAPPALEVRAGKAGKGEGGEEGAAERPRGQAGAVAGDDELLSDDVDFDSDFESDLDSLLVSVLVSVFDSDFDSDGLPPSLARFEVPRLSFL